MQPLKRIAHPSGVHILFDAKWHQYKIGHTKLQSVSKLLDRYFPFDEERILALVSRKQQIPVAAVKEQWNRQALLGKNVHEYIECKLLNKPPPTFVLLMEKQKRDAAKAAQGKAAEAEDETGNNSSSSSSTLSELLHGEEALYLPVADAAVAKVQTGYEVVGVEQVVAAPDWGLAGTIDFVGLSRSNPRKILIGDWKTSGSVTSNFRFGSFETPSENCLRHLPNGKFYRYAMQVIVYGEIIKKEKYVEKGFFDDMLTAALNRMHADGSLAKSAGTIDMQHLSPTADADASAGGRSKGEKTKKGKAKKGKKNKADADDAAASTDVIQTPSVKELLAGFHRGDFTLEYGIVQLSKDEEGGVTVDFKEVTEETVLPPDATDVNFNALLKKVMAGE